MVFFQLATKVLWHAWINYLTAEPPSDYVSMITWECIMSMVVALATRDREGCFDPHVGAPQKCLCGVVNSLILWPWSSICSIMSFRNNITGYLISNTNYSTGWAMLFWSSFSGRDGVSNHQPHRCLLNRLSKHSSKKTSKFRVTGLCAGNSPVTGEFPAQMASNTENVSIWWHHHVLLQINMPWTLFQYKVFPGVGFPL